MGDTEGNRWDGVCALQRRKMPQPPKDLDKVVGGGGPKTAAEMDAFNEKWGLVKTQCTCSGHDPYLLIGKPCQLRQIL